MSKRKLWPAGIGIPNTMDADHGVIKGGLHLFYFDLKR
jgi:hypothetical protein